MPVKKKLQGPDGFEEYYSEIYSGRWPDLKKAMLEDSEPIMLAGPLAAPYYMDKASIAAASFLPIREDDAVLDMCAAPGGKTLVLACKLNGTGSLVSNDRSSQRRNRLHNVIETCLPQELRANITVTGHDSTKWGLYQRDTYDCVLLDAPCSSERHVIKSPAALSEWSTNRPKVLSITQFAMIAAALDAVRPGGFILYSTCSVNPVENSDVIAKLHKKRSGKFTEVAVDTSAEKLEHGYIFLPDRSGGTGPLFFCLLRKVQ